MARAKKIVEEVIADMNEMAEDVEIEDEEINPDDLFPTGSTVLNMAMSGFPNGGYKKGKIVTMPGGSSSGKTLLVLTGMAMTAHDPKFDDYELIYDDVECALEIEIEEIFSEKAAKRIKAPKYAQEGTPLYSDTIQEFKNNVLKRVGDNKPFIWVLDSLDALSSDEELEKAYKEAVKSAKSDDHIKELKGSYKTEKARMIGEVLRMIKKGLKQTGSLLIILQQERINLNAGLFGKKKITSGGEAPFYYSTHQVWLNKIETHKDSKYGIIIGQKVKANVTKNKLTGKKRIIEFDIFDSYGIDDIGSCIDYLVGSGYWKKAGQTIKALELNFEGTRTKLIEYIEENELQDDLKNTVAKAWNIIENEIKLNRKKRFE